VFLGGVGIADAGAEQGDGAGAGVERMCENGHVASVGALIEPAQQ
jgi:hypothetical protein